jgi:hypothetical protein
MPPKRRTRETMSVIGARAENIYSLRVFPSLTDPYATSADSLCRRDGVVQAHKAAEDHRVISRQPMHRFKASKCHPFTGA